MKSQREVFIQMIKDNPRDFTTRKVYADWLDENDEPEEADKQRNWNDEKQDAWEWLEQAARDGGTHCEEGYGSYLDSDEGEIDEKWRNITVDDLIKAGHNFIKSGGMDYWTQVGNENLRDTFYGPKAVEFWEKWELVTGEYVKEEWKNEGPFSCTC